MSTIKKRLIFRQGIEERPQKGKLLNMIKGLLVFAIGMLVFELIAYMKGWHYFTSTTQLLHIPGSDDVNGLLQSIYLGWIFVRERYIAPPLQSLANICIVLFLIQSLDRVIQCIGCVWIKVKNIKPIPKTQSLDTGDAEQPDAGYPMVLIQIPMCNEKEVFIHH